MPTTLSYQNRDANLLILGIVLTSISPVGILVGGNSLRYAVLFAGMLLMMGSLVIRLFNHPINSKNVAVLFGCILALELLSAMNLQEPANMKLAMFRWICYGMAALGISIGGESGFRLPTSTRSVKSLIPLIVCAASLIWISKASSAMMDVRSGEVASARFHGESDDLSPVGVGYTFGIVATVCYALLLTEEKFYYQLLDLAAMALALFALFTTGSRGSLVAFAGVFCFGGISTVRSFSDALRYGIFMLMATCVLAMILSRIPYFQAQMEIFVTRFDFLQSGQRDAAILERFETRQRYFESVNSWIVLGVRGYRYDYPHNFFLECLVRFGALGILLCMVVTGAAFKAIIFVRTVRADSLGLIVLLTGLFTLIVAQFNLMLEFERCLWLFVGYWSVKDVHRLGVSGALVSGQSFEFETQVPIPFLSGRNKSDV